MLEPVVDARAISDLAKALIDRAVAAEPAIRAERDLFRPLARAYFRDRERALAGVAAPLTTLMLEAARRIWDHLIEETIRWGGPWPADPSRRLRGDTRIHGLVTEVLTGTGHLPPERVGRLADAIAGFAPSGEADPHEAYPHEAYPHEAYPGEAVWLRGAA
jgi:hypothetical protein